MDYNLNSLRFKGLGTALKKALSDNGEQRLRDQAERGVRIAKSEVWQKDFFPIICELHDKYLNRVKRGEMHIDSLKSLDDLVAMIDGSVQVGMGAMRRIAENRLRSAEIKSRIDEAKAAS